MAIYVSNSVEVGKSPLNTSSAKQAFSFSKTGRFYDTIPECKSHFYTAKEGITLHKGHGIGYGKRYEFVTKGKHLT